MKIGVDKTFAEFKKDFYDRVKDFSLFDTGDFNLLKVVLDGLKVNYSSKGKIRVVIFRSSVFISFYFFLLRIKNGFKHDGKRYLTKNKTPEYLIIDAGSRTAKTESGFESFYFSNVIKALKRENVFIVLDGNKTILPDHDLHIPVYNLALISIFGSLDENEKSKLEKIKIVFDKIKKSKIFTSSEQADIGVAFQQFFIVYRFWYRMLMHLTPEKVFLLPHYHREGCIYALKEKGIKTIELQHGLISPADIFYVFPEAIRSIQSKALFADEIWVYGQFWKNQLLKGAGYNEEQIKIVGYFPFVAEPLKEDTEKYSMMFPGKKILLVTTQTFLHEYFIRIVKFISNDLTEKKLPWHVLVKIHPAENENTYTELKMLENVTLTNENLDMLFRISEMHLSIYSTTLYDALRYNIPNFCVWFDEFNDYQSLIKEDEIAHIISPDENPVEMLQTTSAKKSVDYYFAKTNYSLFNN